MNSASQLLEKITAAGIELWVQGENLRYKAPVGALTKELREDILVHKKDLIAQLLIENNNIQNSHWDLTEVQTSYLVGRTTAFAAGNTSCQGYHQFQLLLDKIFPADTPFSDVDNYLKDTWGKVVNMHPMLKAVITTEGKQYIDPNMQIPLKIHRFTDEIIAETENKIVAKKLISKQYSISNLDTDFKTPMLDIELVIAPNFAVLHFSVDLIITDYLGIRSLLKDFDTLLVGKKVIAPKSTFFEYLEIYQNLTDSKELIKKREQDELWWLEKISTTPPPLVFSPAINKNSEIDDEVIYKRRSYRLSQQHWNVLVKQAGKNNTTAAATVLAAFALAARRYADNTITETIKTELAAVTMTVVDRLPLVPEVERIVGEFTSTILVSLPNTKNLFQAAEFIRNEIFAALDHNTISGIACGKKLAAQHGLNSQAIPVVFTYTIGDNEVDMPQILSPIIGSGISRTPQVLLDMQVTAIPTGIALDWDMRVDGFNENVLEALFVDFVNIIKQVCDGIEWECVSLQRHTIPKISVTKALCSKLNNDYIPYKTRGLFTGFLHYVKAKPEAAAVYYQQQIFTRDELFQLMLHIAGGLAELGVKIGSAVIIDLPLTPELVAVEYATLFLGAFFVPIDFTWSKTRIDEIKQVVNSADTPIFYINKDNIDYLISSSPLAENLIVQPDEDSLAYVIFTFDSAGIPKGVMITHAQVGTTLLDMELRLNLTPDTCGLAVSKPNYDLSIFNHFGILNAGGSIAIPNLMEFTNPKHWAELLKYHKVTLWNSVPAQLDLLLDYLDSETNFNLNNIQVVLVSGDWVPPTQPERLRQFAPQSRFLALGGAPEISIWSNYHEIDPKAEYYNSIPYGKALNNQNIWVFNSDLEPTVKEQLGEIHIGGSAVAAGYLGDLVQTQAAFYTHPDSKERYYRTGNLGKYLANREIELCGRATREQIRILDYKVDLGEIENVLKRSQNVAEVLAAGVKTANNTSITVAVSAIKSIEGKQKRQQEFSNINKELLAAHRNNAKELNERFLPLQLQSSRIILYIMAYHLQRVMQKDKENLIQVATRLKAENKIHLLRRWLKELHDNKIAEFDREWFKFIVPIPELATSLKQWEEILIIGKNNNYGEQQLRYIDDCVRALPELLAGDTDPLALLFPEGNMELAQGVYGNNMLANYLNSICASGIATLVEERNSLYSQPVRILEVGAGVGGTTEVVLKALQGKNFDYIFTDISNYFLIAAKDRWPEINTKELDINLDLTQQGFMPGSVDIILCANVIHNLDNISFGLSRLEQLLAPGGHIVIIDAALSTPALMVSMEFQAGLLKLYDPNISANRNSPFPTLTEWQQILERYPYVATYPPSDSPLIAGAQQVFWIGVDVAASVIDNDNLNQTTLQLPEAVRPKKLFTLRQIPLTPDGKGDRDQLIRWSETKVDLIDKNIEIFSDELNELELSIAKIWSEVLAVSLNELHKNSNFFELGGDSLLLARCVGRMRRELKEIKITTWDQVMRAVVANPTIADCAKILSNKTEMKFKKETIVKESVNKPVSKSSIKLSSIVVDSTLPLISEFGKKSYNRITDKVNEVVTVLIHDGSGGLAPYKNLIPKLQEKLPLLGITRSAEDNYLKIPPNELFSELQRRYARILLERKITAVHVVGFCMGGLLAAGIASNLVANNVKVHVSAISSYKIPFMVKDDFLLDYAFAKLMYHSPQEMGINVSETALGLALQKFRADGGTIIDAVQFRKYATPELLKAANQAPLTTVERLKEFISNNPDSDWTLNTLLGLRDIFLHSLKAVAAWNEPIFLGKTTFLRQQSRMSFLPTLDDDMTNFWQSYSLGGLNIIDVPGDHFSCLDENNSQKIADVIIEISRNSNELFY